MVLGKPGVQVYALPAFSIILELSKSIRTARRARTIFFCFVCMLLAFQDLSHNGAVRRAYVSKPLWSPSTKKEDQIAANILGMGRLPANMNDIWPVESQSARDF